jgi:hypothetical protein
MQAGEETTKEVLKERVKTRRSSSEISPVVCQTLTRLHGEQTPIGLSRARVSNAALCKTESVIGTKDTTHGVSLMWEALEMVVDHHRQVGLGTEVATLAFDDG